MTIIAYKDGIVAADRLGVEAGLMVRAQKLFRLNDEVIAITGDLERATEMYKWYESGGMGALPPAQNGSWGNMIVFSKKRVKVYSNLGVPLFRTEKVMAFGSGRDIALGAMNSGSSAIDAVKLASKLLDSCGRGVQVMGVK